MARYTIPLLDPETNNESRAKEAVWEYPVFVGVETNHVQRLNAWLRRASLQMLLAGNSELFKKAITLSDRKVVRLLSSSASFASVGIIQATINADKALGQYRTFLFAQGTLGLARPWVGLETKIYSLSLDQSVRVETLFKGNANEVLWGLLQSKMDETTPSCRGLDFDWAYVRIASPTEILFDFPYNPATWEDCGYGSYQLQGKEISALFISPNQLMPGRNLVETQ